MSGNPHDLPDGMRGPVSRGMRYAPNVRRAQGTMKRRPAMKETSTVRVNGNMIFKGHKLTIGVDLGDRWSYYCVLDEAGEVLLEQKLATTPEVMKQTFARIPRSLIALETGTHSPRSEERRVGKECRSRSAAQQQEQKRRVKKGKHLKEQR